MSDLDKVKEEIKNLKHKDKMLNWKINVIMTLSGGQFLAIIGIIVAAFL